MIVLNKTHKEFELVIHNHDCTLYMNLSTLFYYVWLWPFHLQIQDSNVFADGLGDKAIAI